MGLRPPFGGASTHDRKIFAAPLFHNRLRADRSAEDRRLRKAEAVGSNPTRSTSSPDKAFEADSHSASVPADPHLHEFTMLQRAIRTMAQRGAFEEAHRLMLKLYEIAPEDANYSRTKWRFAAEMMKTAVVAQKRAVADEIARTATAKVNAAHLTAAETELMARAIGDVTSL